MAFRAPVAPAPAARLLCRPRVQARSRAAVRVSAAALPLQYSTVKPVGDRVLVKVEEEETQTAGGILLPSSATTKPTAGTVVAVGDGWNAKAGKKMPMDIAMGDRVLYSKYAGTEVEVGGKAHIILKADDCIGSLSGDDVASLKPFGDRLLIAKAAAAAKTAGGVLLPEAAKEQPVTGKVVAAGPGRVGEDGSRTAPAVPSGATVLYSKYAGIDLEGKGGEYVVVREEDILVTLA